MMNGIGMNNNMNPRFGYPSEKNIPTPFSNLSYEKIGKSHQTPVNSNETLNRVPNFVLATSLLAKGEEGNSISLKLHEAIRAYKSPFVIEIDMEWLEALEGQRAAKEQAMSDYFILSDYLYEQDQRESESFMG